MPDSSEAGASVLPYCMIVGQDDLRRALELSFVAGLGVLATGPRGTAKSTTIRAFSLMVHEKLPVTLPIGATDDRVLGGWDLDALLAKTAKPDWRKGLLEKATAAGVLYIDEVNLLDDHIVNLVLDAAATNILEVQRDNADRPTVAVKFSLVGSMNPDEGSLRPQLLDRFSLVVPVDGETDPATRAAILRTILSFDDARSSEYASALAEARARGAARRDQLHAARARIGAVRCPEAVVLGCAAVAHAFRAVGHRGEIVMMRAARAQAALDGVDEVTLEHVRAVARFALIHRRPGHESGTLRPWTADEDKRVADVLSPATAG